jgi:pimeloyl-ACP methyl ester carboxylesterase
LKDKYRVIRFDMTSHGLTGPDHTGDYTLERTVGLMEGLLEELGVEDMYLGGTSMGGTVAMHFTAKHPEQVKNLILISPGTLNTRIKDPTQAMEVPRIMDLLTIITPRAMFGGMLNQGYGDKSKLTDEIIDRWHEMQMREGQRTAEMSRMRQYISGDVPTLMGQLTAPTLVMWGEANPVVPVEQAYQILDMLTNAETELKIYPGVGHMAVLEAPEETSNDIRAYLDTAEAMLVPEQEESQPVAVDNAPESEEPAP